MGEAMARHDEIIESAVEASNGVVVRPRGEGDSRFAVFRRSSDAALGAVAIVRALSRTHWPTQQPLQVRVALHTGEADVRAGDYYGTAVNRCARLRSLANPDQVLVSQAAAELIGTDLPGEMTLLPLGRHYLKDLTEPETVFGLCHPDLPSNFSPLQSPYDPPAHLPSGSESPLPGALAFGDSTHFVGRNRELTHLQGALGTVRSERHRLVLVLGEAGVGKTRLVAEFAKANQSGATVLFGRCSEHAIRPYEPFAEAIGCYLRSGDASVVRRLGRIAGDLARLLPDLLAQDADHRGSRRADPEADRYRLFDAIGTFFASLSSSAPVLLALDDLQWADTATCLLIRRLLRQPGPGGLLIVGTARYPDVAGDASAELIADLTHDGSLERIRLHGLSEGEIAALLHKSEAAGEVSNPLELARALRSETEGNPFYFGQLLRHLLETGTISRFASSRFGSHHLEEVGIPEEVASLIGRRLDRLTVEANSALNTAAVVGRTFGLDVLGQVLEIAEESLLDALEEATEAGIINEVPGSNDGWAFSHALVRDTVYGRLSAARRRRLHRRIGEALERARSRSSAGQPHMAQPFGELALHFERGGFPEDRSKVAAYARAAGEQSLAALAYEDAGRFFQLALDALQGSTEAHAEFVDLLLLLGGSLRRGGSGARARATFSTAAELALRSGDSARFTRAALGFAGPIGASFGESGWGRVDSAAVALLTKALEALGDEQDVIRVQLLGSLAQKLTFDPASDGRRRELLTAAVALARRMEDPEALAYALSTSYLGLWHPANWLERLDHATEMLALAQSISHEELAAQAHVFRIMCHMEIGDVSAADADLADLAADASLLRQPHYLCVATQIRAMRALLEGRYGDAEALAAEAVQHGEQSGDAATAQTFAIQMFTLRWDQGRLSELEEQLEASTTAFPELLAFRALLALVHVTSGRSEEARHQLRGLMPQLSLGLPEDIVWFPTVAALAQVSAALREVEASRILYDLLLPYDDRMVTVGFAVAFWGAVSHHLGALATALGAWDEAERHYRVALEAHTRMGAEPWQNRTRFGWAEVLLRRGRDGDERLAASLIEQATASDARPGMGEIVKHGR
jgi:tetratricopeptide (TPR) repeat protein